jgi:hypothetical protein
MNHSGNASKPSVRQTKPTESPPERPVKTAEFPVVAAEVPPRWGTGVLRDCGVPPQAHSLLLICRKALFAGLVGAFSKISPPKGGIAARRRNHVPQKTTALA